jgi:signal transduction histidine kinase
MRDPATRLLDPAFFLAHKGHNGATAPRSLQRRVDSKNKSRLELMAQRPHILAEDVLHHFLGISRALAGQLDFQSMIDAVSREISPILPHDHLDVCLFVLDGREHITYESGVHTLWGDVAQPMPVHTSPIRTVLLGEQAFLLTHDAMNDARFAFPGAINHPIFDARLRSRLHVPLRARGEIIGALSCSKHTEHFYTLDDVRHTQHVADLLASYVYALRQTEQAKQLAIAEAQVRAREEGLRQGALRLTEELERERQRVGMDLHDQTLADLTRLHRRIARLETLPNVPGEDLRGIARALKDSMQELRQLIDAVKPTVLQLFGFEEGLEDLLRRSVRDSGLSIATRLQDSTRGMGDRLPESVKVALFRIIQEAVNNAIKHAMPDSIVINISQTDAGLQLTIDDDGVGLEADQRFNTGGIQNMQVRAQLMAAQLQIEPGPGERGTRVRVCLPLTDFALEPVIAAEVPCKSC